MLNGVLVIAGTDSSNGAGLTLDLRVINDIGIYGFGAVTCVTAQNLNEILSIEPIKKDIFNDELLAISNFYGILAIKIGLIPNKKILKKIHKFLEAIRNHEDANIRNIPVVWDPVGVSTSGYVMTEIDFAKAMKKLLPLVTVFTPNLTECVELSNLEVNASTLEDYLASLKEMALYFRNLGAKNVLIKGGHIRDYSGFMPQDKFDKTVFDYLESEHLSKPFYYMNKKIGQDDSFSIHGSGCMFSSALASYLAKGLSVEDALVFAKGYVTRSFLNCASVEGSTQKHIKLPLADKVTIQDYPLVGHSITDIERYPFNCDDDGFPKLKDKLGFYVIVDSSKWIERLCKAGVKTMQLRIKEPKSQRFLENEIKKSVEIANKYDVQLFIDDYWELAIKYKAYGVHLGQEDLDKVDLRDLDIGNVRLGVSTHNWAEVFRALLVKPSYIALGHIFDTQTKDFEAPPQGVIKLKRYVELLKENYPLVAIGGIKLENLNDVLETGIDSVAVVTAITKAENPEEAIKEWMDALNKPREI